MAEFPESLRRFIPARAGNTASPGEARHTGPVHPRARGEHLTGRPRRCRQTGSSPRARGTRLVHGKWDAHRRFIPARAGNTSGPRSWRGRRTVHPRARGEHEYGVYRMQYVGGSSPRARGTRGPQALDVRHRRFIPARAGNTSRDQIPAPTLAVHPRARGEHIDAAKTRGSRFGSSPRARGTLRGPRDRRGRDRFIPARAGNT